MDRDEELARAIRQRDVRAAIALVFEGHAPVVKTGFRTEGELWDFKSYCRDCLVPCLHLVCERDQFVSGDLTCRCSNHDNEDNVGVPQDVRDFSRGGDIGWLSPRNP